jgi:hypothetical protein
MIIPNVPAEVSFTIMLISNSKHFRNHFLYDQLYKLCFT